MKKRLLPLGLVLAALAAGQPAAGQSAAGQPAAGQPAAGQPAAQTAPGQPLSVYTRQAVSQTAIRLLLSHYGQDGTHSAVTGGQGTEALTVTAPELTVTHQPDSAQTV